MLDRDEALSDSPRNWAELGAGDALVDNAPEYAIQGIAGGGHVNGRNFVVDGGASVVFWGVTEALGSRQRCTEGERHGDGSGMTTTETTAVTRDELVDRARALQPLLAHHAGDSDINRRLPDEVIDALTQACLFRLMTPRRFGGYAVPSRTVVEVSEALAMADASAGWVVGLNANVAWAAAHGTEQMQQEIFGANPDVKLAGSGQPVPARLVDGGVQFSGRWAYASGSPHADWAGVGVAVDKADGEPPEMMFAFVPRSEMRLEDTWHTVGMRGSGSNTWAGEDIFVPEHRLMPVGGVVEPSPLEEEPVYRLPVGTVGTMTVMGTVLGLGRVALQYTIGKASSKGLQHTFIARQSDSVGVQMQIAEAALKIETARLHVYQATDDLAEATLHPETLDYALRARVRGLAGYAAQQVLEAIQTLLSVHGSGSFAESNPMQRIWRDANVAARHAGLNTAIGLEVFGKSLLGVPDRISPLV
ncbi:acyl-CoA dehydrogenase family protein [Mycolicibacterium goodii]|uniref:acyl-CoA dehydrogenase family protein n=1 Tax=Mycolicibacterium goodii TaxID=134601 RepID=UPI00256F47FF|nr:acyl-CoA dehydrogenase family protein [Mycolicibacterium goodii]